MDADGEDEDAPANRRVNAKANGRASAGKNGAPEDDDDQDQDEAVDVENYPDQPLGHEQFIHINGVANDWKGVEANLRGLTATLFNDIATGLIDSDSAEIDKDLEELDKLLKDVIDIQSEMSTHESILREIQAKGLEGNKIENVATRYIEASKEKIEEYKARTSRQKYGRHDLYSSFRETVWSAQNADENAGMPPINDFIPKEDGDDSDDDDIEIGGITQQTKCPLSLQPLEDPMSSSVCKHSFDAKTLRDFFQDARGAQLACPVTGCDKRFALKDCFLDEDLKQKVKIALKRRKKRQADDSDDAEEID